MDLVDEDGSDLYVFCADNAYRCGQIFQTPNNIAFIHSAMKYLQTQMAVYRFLSLPIADLEGR